MDKTKYVCGLMFNDDFDRVALIHKNRPDWQKNKWNGIGGHVEGDEPYRNAMAREFYEETTVKTEPENWLHFATFENDKAIVMFYMTVDAKALHHVRTATDEPVYVHDVAQVLSQNSFIVTVPNIPALVGMASSVYNYNLEPYTIDR